MTGPVTVGKVSAGWTDQEGSGALAVDDQEDHH